MILGIFIKEISLWILAKVKSEFLWKSGRMRKTVGTQAIDEGFYSLCCLKAIEHQTFFYNSFNSTWSLKFVSVVRIRSHWFRSTVWWVWRILTLTFMSTLVVPLSGIMFWRSVVINIFFGNTIFIQCVQDAVVGELRNSSFRGYCLDLSSYSRNWQKICNGQFTCR